MAWHVDNLKMSHVEQSVLEELLTELNAKFRKEKLLTITQGKIHEYLGTTIDYSFQGKVKFIMTNFEDGIIAETPPELLKVEVQTPAALHLFEVNQEGEKLEKEQQELFHHLVAKLLYLTKRSRRDVMVATAFLTTQVRSPDHDDWKMLGRVITYLQDTRDLHLTLKASKMNVIR